MHYYMWIQNLLNTKFSLLTIMLYCCIIYITTAQLLFYLPIIQLFNLVFIVWRIYLL